MLAIDREKKSVRASDAKFTTSIPSCNVTPDSTVIWFECYNISKNVVLFAFVYLKIGFIRDTSKKY